MEHRGVQKMAGLYAVFLSSVLCADKKPWGPELSAFPSPHPVMFPPHQIGNANNKMQKLLKITELICKLK